MTVGWGLDGRSTPRQHRPLPRQRATATHLLSGDELHVLTARGRVVGLYIATLFVVWQVINAVIFRELPTMPILVGGTIRTSSRTQWLMRLRCCSVRCLFGRLRFWTFAGFCENFPCSRVHRDFDDGFLARNFDVETID